MSGCRIAIIIAGLALALIPYPCQAITSAFDAAPTLIAPPQIEPALPDALIFDLIDVAYDVFDPRVVASLTEDGLGIPTTPFCRIVREPP